MNITIDAASADDPASVAFALDVDDEVNDAHR